MFDWKTGSRDIWICDVICLFHSRAKVTYSADPCPSQCSSGIRVQYNDSCFVYCFSVYRFLGAQHIHAGDYTLMQISI